MCRTHRLAGRSAFTLIELLVVISIIGLLAAILLPAVQSARETVRAAQCKNHLRQIAVATEMFHSSQRAYPPARYQPRPGEPPGTDCGGNETTWLVRILPFLEQSSAEDRWEYSLPYANHPDPVREQSFEFYVCPTRRSPAQAVGKGLLTATTTTWYTLPCGCQIPVTTTGATLVSGAVGDYGGNHGDLSPGASGLSTDFYYGGNGTGLIISSRASCSGATPRDWIDRIGHRDVLDGLTYTFLAGEMHVPLGKLGRAPEDAFIFNGDHLFNCARVGGPTVPIVSDIRSEGNSLVAWGSWHPGICHFAFGDGSVRAISVQLDTDVLARLAHRADRRSLPAEF